MAKMMKLYRIDLEKAKGLNIAHFNPTCKAILKAMYRLEKQNADETYNGATGEDILSFAVEQGLWSTRQEPSKYHTTWAYYVKKLKTEAPVYETGSVRGLSTEEYLDQDEEPGMESLEDIMDDPNEENPVDEEEFEAQAAA